MEQMTGLKRQKQRAKAIYERRKKIGTVFWAGGFEN
jgi:hypothetical protein